MIAGSFLCHEYLRGDYDLALRNIVRLIRVTVAATDGTGGGNTNAGWSDEGC